MVGTSEDLEVPAKLEKTYNIKSDPTDDTYSPNLQCTDILRTSKMNELYGSRINYSYALLVGCYRKEYLNKFETENGKRYAENLIGFEAILDEDMYNYVNQITLAYRYMANYCLVKGANKQAKGYFNKILEYIPNDEDALNVLKTLKKY